MLITGEPTGRPADLKLVDDAWAASKLSPDELNIISKNMVEEEENKEKNEDKWTDIGVRNLGLHSTS